MLYSMMSLFMLHLALFLLLFALCIGYNASDSDSDEMTGEAQ